MRHAVVTLVS